MTMLTTIKPLLDWMHIHPQWAGWVVCGISFLESLAVVGLLIPGTVVMTALGSLIGAGIIPFTGITLYVVAGAVAGDVLSFWLGSYYHEKVRQFWPFRTHPSLLQKGENFFLRHGGKGIFMGRFVGPIRPILPMIAGMMSMPPLRFVIADVVSAIIWAPLMMLPGILLGVASQAFAPEFATRLILSVVLILLVLWCISWLIKRAYLSFVRFLHNHLATLWQLIQTRPGGKMLKRLLIDPAHPQSHSQLTTSILFVITLFAFCFVTYSVMHHGVITQWNEPVYYFMRSLRMTAFDPSMLALTTLANPPVILFMWLAVSVWLLLRRKWWASLHWFGIGMLCIVVGEATKLLVRYPRPTGLLQQLTDWSYPSGHSLLSIALFGFFVTLLARNWRSNQRWLAYGFTALLVLAIMFSRLYLGAHWLSDVLGGALLGLCLLTLTLVSYRRKATPTIKPVGLLFIALLALAIAWSAYVVHSFRKDLQNNTVLWSIQTLDAKGWWAQADGQQLLYRTNRFGKPIEILNIQWAGYLPTIEQSLSKRGWSLLPRASLLLVLDQLAAKHHYQQLPIMSQLYEDHKPVLIMFKRLNYPVKVVIVIRLWEAHIRLSNGTPLWLGTVSYHEPWHANFLAHQAKIDFAKLKPLPPSTVLVADLASWTWKKNTYAIPAAVDWDGNILLIKPVTPAHITKKNKFE